ncbi:MAG TPA: hypothetical protein VF630_16395 [Hymenobacter sp.]|jgi:hypothetical protein
MPDAIILAESYGSVLADARVPCVIVQFHAFANRAEFVNIMETGLAYYAAHATPKRPWGWIGDVRRMGAIPQAVQDWLTTDWNVRAFQAGVREVSIVVAENVLGQLATQQYVRNTTARQDQYEIATATYPSLVAAKQGARAAFLL